MSFDREKWLAEIVKAHRGLLLPEQDRVENDDLLAVCERAYAEGRADVVAEVDVLFDAPVAEEVASGMFTRTYEKAPRLREKIRALAAARKEGGVKRDSSQCCGGPDVGDWLHTADCSEFNTDGTPKRKATP